MKCSCYQINLVETAIQKKIINMFRLSIWFFRIYQFFGFFAGYIYSYVDSKKCEIKFYTIWKIYVYFFNLVTFYKAMVIFIRHTRHFDSFEGATLIAVFPRFAHAMTIVFFILLRIEEERMYKELLVTFIPLQRTYFEKLAHILNDKIIEVVLILQIFLTIALNDAQLTEMFIQLWFGEWSYATDLLFSVIGTMMPYYVLWRHGFILNYINNIFLNLNNQLRLEQVEEPFAKIYINIISALQNVNVIYSPIIFCALLDILVSQSIYIFGLFCLIVQNKNEDILNYLTALSVQFCGYMVVFLYFFICERITETLKDADGIIMEYNTRSHNVEVRFLK